ncbi:MAG: tyrosine-protein phosphatase [Bacilli bacterium]|nr:tyrosine-protein phosphatase [Bacilli bacterium]
MKKYLILLSAVAALALSGCQFGPSSNGDGDGDNSANTPSNSSIDDSSSKEDQVVEGDNFTITVPADLSSMSANCKKYVDDMRAQQRKFISENGQDADYYLNELYGNNGVDITKGITEGDNGGYRPANVNNDYLDPVAAEWEKGEKSDENKGVNISFVPSDALKNKQYTITYSKNADLSGAKTITQSETTVNLKNLLVNQKYYLKVTADGQESEIINFTTGDYPRWINARPMFNVRDHGGYMTSSGQRIKQGLIYRGGEITPATGWKSGQMYTGDVGGRYTDSNGRMQDGHITSQTNESKEVFRNVMGMVNGLEIDLRSSGERNNYTACGFANGGDISYKLLSISSYDNGMKNNKNEIKQVFEAFAQADQHPVYYHCYGGADRTGVVGFMLGALLGMSYTDLVIDFELTTYSSNPSRNYRSHLRAGPYNYWPRMVTYLKNTLGWNSSKTMKQSMEEFLINQCSVSQTTINKIRSIMLEPAQ